jgi:hypothetical protein
MSPSRPASPLPWRIDLGAPDPEGRSWVRPEECVVAANGVHVICAGHHYEEGGDVDRADAAYIVTAANVFPHWLAALNEIANSAEDDMDPSQIARLALERLR